MNLSKSNPPLELQSLSEIIDESLCLLGAKETTAAMLDAVDNIEADLFEQSIELCRQGITRNAEPIRSIHYLSYMGNMLIPKCLAEMPNVLMLNTVLPMSLITLKPDGASLGLTEMLLLVQQENYEIPEDLLVRLLLQYLNLLQKEVGSIGKRILIYDNTYKYFINEDKKVHIPNLFSAVNKHFPITSIIIVEEPLDNFLSLVRNGWLRFESATFDEYCRRYIALLDAYSDTAIVRYEDFVTDPPASVLQMCEVLRLTYLGSSVDTFDSLEPLNDTCLKEVATRARLRREINDDFLNAVDRSGFYHELIERLNYQQLMHTQALAGQQPDQLNPPICGEEQRQVAKNKTTVSSCVSPPTNKEDQTLFSHDAYVFYKDISKAYFEKIAPPFILLDSKSLPRSGLHYMKNTFAKLLEGHFSFCEWYQEPGCCKKMPCALTGYAEHCKRSQTPRLRLIKSHDFALADPVFLPNFSVRRVILVRNPLFLLTSFFALHQLGEYKAELQKKGINLQKIWLSHEPEVLATAYEVMDESFIAPDAAMLVAWLEEKVTYISAFLDKWVYPAKENPQPFLNVVCYEEINSFILSTIDEVSDYLPEEVKRRLDAFIQRGTSGFQPRQNPYQVPSEKLTSYLTEKANAFVTAASKIAAADRSGVMHQFRSNEWYKMQL